MSRYRRQPSPIKNINDHAGYRHYEDDKVEEGFYRESDQNILQSKYKPSVNTSYNDTSNNKISNLQRNKSVKISPRQSYEINQNVSQYDDDNYNARHIVTKPEPGTPRRYHMWDINDEDDDSPVTQYDHRAMYSKYGDDKHLTSKFELEEQQDSREKPAKIQSLKGQSSKNTNKKLYAAVQDRSERATKSNYLHLENLENNEDSDSDKITTYRFSKSIENMIGDLNMDRLDPTLRNLLENYAGSHKSTDLSKNSNTLSSNVADQQHPSHNSDETSIQFEEWKEIIKSIEKERERLEVKVERKLSPRSKKGNRKDAHLIKQNRQLSEFNLDQDYTDNSKNTRQNINQSNPVEYQQRKQRKLTAARPENRNYLTDDNALQVENSMELKLNRNNGKQNLISNVSDSQDIMREDRRSKYNAVNRQSSTAEIFDDLPTDLKASLQPVRSHSRDNQNRKKNAETPIIDGTISEENETIRSKTATTLNNKKSDLKTPRTPRNEKDLDRIRQKRLAYLAKNAARAETTVNKADSKAAGKSNQNNKKSSKTNDKMSSIGQSSESHGSSEYRKPSESITAPVSRSVSTAPRNNNVGVLNVGVPNTTNLKYSRDNEIPELELEDSENSDENVAFITHRESETNYSITARSPKDSLLTYEGEDSENGISHDEDLDNLQRFSWSHTDPMTQRSPRKENRINYSTLASIWGIDDDNKVSHDFSDPISTMKDQTNIDSRQKIQSFSSALSPNKTTSKKDYSTVTDNKLAINDHSQSVATASTNKDYDSAIKSTKFFKASPSISPTPSQTTNKVVKVCPTCRSHCNHDSMFCIDCGTTIISVSPGFIAEVDPIPVNNKLQTKEAEREINVASTDTNQDSHEDKVSVTRLQKSYSEAYFKKTPIRSHNPGQTSSKAKARYETSQSLDSRNRSKILSTDEDDSILETSDHEGQMISSKNLLSNYKRHWQKSSTAWSSFNSNELSNPPASSLYPAIINESSHGYPDQTISILKYSKPNDVITDELTSEEDNHSDRNRIANKRLSDYYYNNLVNSPLSLLDLPDELLLMILSKIPQKELIKCSMVCRRLYWIANDSALWNEIIVPKNVPLSNMSLKAIGRRKPVCLTLPQMEVVESEYSNRATRSSNVVITVDGLRQLFRQCSDSLQEFTMAYVPTTTSETIGDEVLVHIATRCPNVHTIHCSQCNVSDDGIISILEGCKSMISIDLSGCLNISNRTISTIASRHGDSICYLDISGCSKIDSQAAKMIAYNCKNIISLNLGQCYKLSNDDISRLAANLKHIEKIGLRGISQITDDCVSFLARNWQKLSDISLAKCSKITDIAMNELAIHRPSIRCLDICGCEMVTDNSINVIAQHCHSLEVLDLSSTNITRSSVKDLANSQCYRTLKSIKLSFCRDVTHESLIYLVKHCKRLKSLHIYGCKRIRDTDMLRGLNIHLNIER
ncbi:F-box/LRR-repeat protein 7 [Trichoplax sp. H2]|nr:F-box/LRR-repeat protein 7 [Trichoplax sp. H2]|eukprot:RDD40315.1 F-box/LRR-repeat protein 7 [Trichoplax sp. H2]